MSCETMNYERESGSESVPKQGHERPTSTLEELRGVAGKILLFQATLSLTSGYPQLHM